MSIIKLHKDYLDKLLIKLQSNDGNIRENALKKLEKTALSPQEGLRILEFTKRKFPPSEYEWNDIPARLIDICAKRPYVEYIEKVESIFDHISLPAKISVLLFLTEYEREDAITLYLKLLGKIYTNLNGVPIGSLQKNPRYPDILFPELLKYIDNKFLTRDIYHILLTYFQEGLVSEEHLGSYKNEVVKDIIFMAKKILEYDIDDDPVAIWDDYEYLELRNFADVHFDLAGYIKDLRIIEALNDLLNVNDMRIKMFVVLSLLKHGCNVDEKHFSDIAQSKEMRNWFYKGLIKLGYESYFPEKYKSQESFAESDMVDWLCYPTELGRVPDEIELMQIIEISNTLYYLFRFRSEHEDWVDTGWMAGVSGGYKKNTLSIDSSGYTFSKFEEWDSKSPKEHVESLLMTIKTFIGMGK